jgi:hypothetical protein
MDWGMRGAMGADSEAEWVALLFRIVANGNAGRVGDSPGVYGLESDQMGKAQLPKVKS